MPEEGSRGRAGAEACPTWQRGSEGVAPAHDCAWVGEAVAHTASAHKVSAEPGHQGLLSPSLALALASLVLLPRCVAVSLFLAVLAPFPLAARLRSAPRNSSFLLAHAHALPGVLVSACRSRRELGSPPWPTPVPIICRPSLSAPPTFPLHRSPFPLFMSMSHGRVCVSSLLS